MTASDSNTSETKKSDLSPKSRADWHGWLGMDAAVVWLICTLMFFWQFFSSSFDLVTSDPGDGRLYLTILEHWLHVFHGQASLASPIFFYPEHGVLGYSDTLFLFSIPYALVRMLGFDSYLSLELTLMVVKTIGFVTMLLWLQNGLRVPRGVALWGAALFTLSNIYLVHAGHVQLAGIAFVPLILWLASGSAAAAGQSQALTARWLAAAAGIVFALLFLTSFYVAWFAALFGGIFLVAWGVVQTVVSGQTKVLQRVWVAREIVLAGGAAFAVALVPFFLVYYPVVQRVRGRTIFDALYSMPDLADMFNAGNENLLWGWLIRAHFPAPDPLAAVERMVGWPLLTVLTVVGIAAVLVYQFLVLPHLSQTSRAEDSGRRGVLMGSLLFTIALICVIEVKFGETLSLWRLVYDLVPGATAIRVPGRINFMVNVAVVAVLALGLQQLWNVSGRRATARAITILLGALILIEQVNLRSTHVLSRAAEARIFKPIQPAPSGCSTFYLTQAIGGNALDLQTEAMIVAERLQIPTVDGYSGWSPRDWNLFTADSGMAFRAAGRWAIEKNIQSGLCSLELTSGQWSRVDTAAVPGYKIGDTVEFGAPASTEYTLTGWFGPERGWGNWTIGPESELLFYVPEAPSSDLMLQARVHPFLAPSRPAFQTTVYVNGIRVASWSFKQGDDPAERTAMIPGSALRGNFLRIRLTNDNLRSPAEAGVNGDRRRLSVALISATIRKP